MHFSMRESCSRRPFGCRKLPLERLQLGWAQATAIRQYAPSKGASEVAAFGLEVEPSKTAMLCFGELAPWACKRAEMRCHHTFNFLTGCWKTTLVVFMNEKTEVRAKSRADELRR